MPTLSPNRSPGLAHRSRQADKRATDRRRVRFVCDQDGGDSRSELTQADKNTWDGSQWFVPERQCGTCGPSVDHELSQSSFPTQLK